MEKKFQMNQNLLNFLINPKNQMVKYFLEEKAKQNEYQNMRNNNNNNQNNNQPLNNSLNNNLGDQNQNMLIIPKI